MLVVVGAAHSSTLTPVGDLIDVDGPPPEATPPTLFDPDVAAAAGGGFIVTWPGWEEVDEAVVGITRARRFDASGQAVSEPVDLGRWVQPGTDLRHRRGIVLSFDSDPAVAASPDGTFVVVWPSLTWDGLYSPVEDIGLEGRRVDADGLPLGATFRVATGTAGGFPQQPDVAVASGGDFVVVWENGPGDHTLSLRHYDAAGDPIGEPVAIADADATGNDERVPSLALVDADRVVVTWRSLPSGGATTYRALAQLLSTDGTSLASSVEVSTVAIEGPALTPSVASLPAGGAYVAWNSDGDDVLGREVDASGLPVGFPFTLDDDAGGTSVVVRTTTARRQLSPLGVVALWGKDGPGNDNVGGRLLDASGRPAGAIFSGRVDTGAGTEFAAIGPGRRLVAVGSQSPQGVGGGIRARILAVGLAVFSDGFESGSVSGWDEFSRQVRRQLRSHLRTPMTGTPSEFD